MREPQYYKTHFGLTDAWDTRTCKGRALNATQKKAFEDRKDFCRDLITCMTRIVACNDPRTGRSRKENQPMFCTQSACDDGFIHNTLSKAKQQAIDDCAKQKARLTQEISYARHQKKTRATAQKGSKLIRLFLQLNSSLNSFVRRFHMKHARKSPLFLADHLEMTRCAAGALYLMTSKKYPLVFLNRLNK